MSYSKFSVMSKMNEIFAEFNEIRCFLLSPKKKTYAKNSFILHFILTVLMLLKICLILNYSRCLEGSVPPVKLAPIYNFYSSLPHVKISQLLPPPPPAPPHTPLHSSRSHKYDNYDKVSYEKESRNN